MSNENARKLSSLKVGDTFKFQPNQEVLYITNSRTNRTNSFTPGQHTQYEVLKVNETSIKTRIKMGRFEYTFKFAGVGTNYTPGIDALITLT